jgi:hypothetical protein
VAATSPARPPENVAKDQKTPATPVEPAPLPSPAAPACETFGTRVQFVSNPTDAARMARQENKLMFVLHISGNFEDARFT